MVFSAAARVSTPNRITLAGVFALAIVVASTIPAPSVLAHTGPFDLFGLDKWIHFLSYGVLAVFISYALWAYTSRTLLAVALVTIFYGIGIELIQGAISWRSMEMADVVANTTGTLVGLLLWRVFTRNGIREWRRESEGDATDHAAD